jgi:hypothetical protein
MYQELKDVFQYLVSVRKLKSYLSIDIEFPIHWKIPKKFVREDKIVENQKVHDDKRFFSFVSEFNDLNKQHRFKYQKYCFIQQRNEMKESLLNKKLMNSKEYLKKENLENLHN